MNHEQLQDLAPKVVRAVEELEGMVRAHYPSATFQVARAADDPESILLWTTVDVDDPDEVGDLVLDRLLEMQIDEGIPIHLIPVRTPERVMASMKTEPRRKRGIAKIVSTLGEQATQ